MTAMKTEADGAGRGREQRGWRSMPHQATGSSNGAAPESHKTGQYNGCGDQAYPRGHVAEPRPHHLPSITPYVRRVQADDRQQRPPRRCDPGLGSRDSGTIMATKTTPMTTMGTLMRNTEPHQKCSISRPPTMRPDRDSEASRGRPDADGPTPLSRIEDVGDDRQGGRHDSGGAETHHRASADQFFGDPA